MQALLGIHLHLTRPLIIQTLDAQVLVLTAAKGGALTPEEIDDLVICPVAPDNACIEVPGSRQPRVFVPMVSIRNAKLAVTLQEGKDIGWGLDGTYKVCSEFSPSDPAPLPPAPSHLQTHGSLIALL
jgi:hypothetical protein